MYLQNKKLEVYGKYIYIYIYIYVCVCVCVCVCEEIMKEQIGADFYLAYFYFDFDYYFFK